MSTKTLKTIIQLRRDTEVNWNKIKDSFIPKNGEVCFIDTTDGLRAKVGDGATLFKDLKYTDEYVLNEIDRVVLNGYYLNSKFYTDSTYTIELEKNINKIYIDKNSNIIYHYNGEKYISVNDTLPTASDIVAGIAKLYQDGGQNIDGAMSQKAVTDGVQSISFAIDETDTECLILELPWEV